MYEKFFQFTESPFRLTPDPRFFFFSKKHEEAFDHIRYGIQERKGFIVVTGEVGTGKTTLSRLLLEKLDKKIQTSMIFNPSLGTNELLQSIVLDFGLPEQARSKKALVAHLNRFLLKTLEDGANALLIIDESQNLSVECLEEIRMLSNLETDTAKLLQILLVGQPELRTKLKDPSLRQLNQRIAIRYHIEPLDPREAEDYVNYRLRVAGSGERVFFTPKAFEELYRHSGGVPRLINILCDKALLAAYAQESRVVDQAAVVRAAAEMDPPSGTEAEKSNGAELGRWSRHADRTAHHRPMAGLIAGGIALAVLLLGILAVAIWGLPRASDSSLRDDESPLPVPSIASGAVSGGRTESEPIPTRPDGGAGFHEPPAMAADFDAEGVFRVTRPDQTHKASLLTILRLWGIVMNPAPEAFVESNDNRLMADQGLSSYPLPQDLYQARLFDLPAVVSGTWSRGTTQSFVVLAALSDHEATILDPLKGRAVVDLRLFKTLWDGRGTLYWKPMPGIRLPLKSKGEDPSVRTIQRALKVQGLYLGTVDGILGPHTKRAIMFFNQKQGLKDTAEFGLESHLVLSRVMLRDAPGLQMDEL